MGTPLTAIDLKRLAAEVSVQHGIRIDPDDPMLAVVTLNRLVFEHAVAQVLERMQSSVQDFEAATEKVQVRAGAALAQEVRNCARRLSSSLTKRSKGGAGPVRPRVLRNAVRFYRTGTPHWAQSPLRWCYLP